MLILTRKIQESIMINDNIEVKILSIADGKVKLGIEAPMDVVIHRNEVFEEVKKQNKEAANSSLDISEINRRFMSGKL